MMGNAAGLPAIFAQIYTEGKNHMEYQTILFDLDGTLLDSLPGLLHSVNAAMIRCGCPVHTYEEVRSFVGNGVRKLMERALPGQPDGPGLEDALAAFAEDYKTAMFSGSTPYPGILPLLKTLHEEGYAMAVVSNKTDSAVQALVERFFGEFIAVAVGDRPGLARKPAPDGVYAALSALGREADCAVYVGDSEVDVETARRAGLPCLSVAWGNRTAHTLLRAGAASISHTPEELLAAIHAGGAGLQR